MTEVSTGTYLVERSATIAAEPQRIYDQLVDFHAWLKWSPWEDLDPQQVRSFTGVGVRDRGRATPGRATARPVAAP